VKKILAITQILSFFLPSLVGATTYCVKPDGGVSAASMSNAIVADAAACTAANLTGNNPGGALSPAAFAQVTTFQPGDTVYWSALNLAGAPTSYKKATSLGSNPAVMHVVCSGTAAAPIEIVGIGDGTAGAYPILDVTGTGLGCTAEGHAGNPATCLDYADNNVFDDSLVTSVIIILGDGASRALDYVNIRNFTLKGSSLCATGYFPSGGTSGSGYTIKLYNIDSTNSNESKVNCNGTPGVCSGKHGLDSPCIGAAGSAQIEVHDSNIHSCVVSIQTCSQGLCAWGAAGSSPKVKGYNNTITGCGQGLFQVANGQVYCNNCTLEGQTISNLAISSGAGSSGYVWMDGGSLIVDSTGYIFATYASADPAAYAKISNATIDMQNSPLNIIAGQAILQNNIITYNSPNHAFGLNAGSNFQMNGGNLTIDQVNGYWLASNDSGAMYLINGVEIFGDSITGTNPVFLYNTTSSTSQTIEKCIIHDASLWYKFIWQLDGALNVYNNTFYSADHNNHVFYETGGTINVINNIFYYTTNVGGGMNTIFYNSGGTLNEYYNDYFNVNSQGGANDIASDPQFVNPGADFHLKPTSPCRNAGVSVGLPYCEGAPDMGALEYCPGSLWFGL
jgi:hypothetical protein